jgi:hypothetical protein
MVGILYFKFKGLYKKSYFFLYITRYQSYNAKNESIEEKLLPYACLGKAVTELCPPGRSMKFSNHNQYFKQVYDR